MISTFNFKMFNNIQQRLFYRFNVCQHSKIFFTFYVITNWRVNVIYILSHFYFIKNHSLQNIWKNEAIRKITKIIIIHGHNGLMFNARFLYYGHDIIDVQCFNHYSIYYNSELETVLVKVQWASKTELITLITSSLNHYEYEITP